MIDFVHTPTMLRNAVALTLAITMLIVGSGCNVIGVLAGKVAGEPPVPAQYVPEKTTPLLVIAENYRDPSMTIFDAERIARYVSAELERKEVAPIVPQDKLAIVRNARPGEFAKMTVVDLAKAVGARQVVYIDVGSVAVGNQSGSDLLKGIASARVSVIDIDTGRAVFPGGLTDGLQVGFETPIRRAGDHATPESVRGETITGLGGRIARLFHKWQPEDIETMNPEL